MTILELAQNSTPAVGDKFYVVDVSDTTDQVGGTGKYCTGTDLVNAIFQAKLTLGANVTTALATDVGSAGAFVVLGGAGGTPSAITLTNGTGLPIAGITGLGSNVGTALGVAVGSTGGPVVNGGALGTPSSGTLINCTGLPLGNLANSSAGADRFAMWDQSANDWVDGTFGTGFTINGTTVSVTASGTGDVVGPASATDNAIVVYDGTTGKLVKDSTVTISSGSMTVPGDVTATGASVTTFGILDTNASHELRIACGSDLTAHRILTFTTGDAPRTVTISGDCTLPAGTALVSGGALGTPSSGTLSSCTVDGTDAVGFRNVPSNSQSTAYTAVLADAGKSIDHPASDANARTFTIPANASVAYAVGTCLSFSNMTSQVVTIAITSDTLYLAGTGSTGSRSLAQYGVATARKITSTAWLINGTGLT